MISDKVKTMLEKEESTKKLSEIYGSEKEQLDFQKSRYFHLAELFDKQFPDKFDYHIFSTSGRTEIAGNHTDHQQGHVLCASVDMDIIAVVSKNDDNVIRLKSEGYKNMDVIDLGTLEPVEVEKFKSASLIRGIASVFSERGYNIGGFDAYTTSRVPKGSGLSSSAAFEILVSTIINNLFNDGTVDPVEMAVISQKAENNFFGKPCGLMDQCGCAAGKVMSIDFKIPGSPKLENIDVSFEDYGYNIVITNTGGSHANLNDDYAQITRDMKSVADFFNKDYLSQVAEKDFYSSIKQLREKVSDKAILRAMHFFNDDRRVTEQIEALKSSDICKFLCLVNESGISSWTYLQNIFSVKDFQNQPVALALGLTRDFLKGDGALRVHGGGFAGTIQAFVPVSKTDEYISFMSEIFGDSSSWKIKIRNKPSAKIF